MDLVSKEVSEALNRQAGREFKAMMQYLAIANYFHSETLPELARFFYDQSNEERQHAMKFIQFLHDTGVDLDIPEIPKVNYRFNSVEEAVEFSLKEEVDLSNCIHELLKLARSKEDYATENFLGFFVTEQIEEMSAMQDLLATVKRAGPERLFQVEEYILRQKQSELRVDKSST